VAAGGLDLQPRLTGAAEAELLVVRGLIASIALRHGEDRRVIDSPSAPRFCSREAYRSLAPVQPLDTSACMSWALQAPSKIKIFTYLADIDRLSTQVNLFHKSCAPSDACAACPCPETGRHLFFACRLATATWSRLDVPIPAGDFSIWELQAPAPFDPAVWRVGVAAILWSLWKSRNDLVFNGVAHSADSTLRRVCDDLALWRWRFRVAHREPLDILRSYVLSCLES
jgi:hypothetical protein